MERATTWAIWAFKKVCMKERQLKVAKDELAVLLKTVPKVDMLKYKKITKEIKDKYDRGMHHDF